MSNEPKEEQRQGQTGIWTLVLRQPDGTVLARSQWGTNYEFNTAEWGKLPLLP